MRLKRENLDPMSFYMTEQIKKEAAEVDPEDNEDGSITIEEFIHGYGDIDE